MRNFNGEKSNSALKFIDELQLKIKTSGRSRFGKRTTGCKKAADLMSPFYNVLATFTAPLSSMPYKIGLIRLDMVALAFPI